MNTLAMILLDGAAGSPAGGGMSSILMIVAMIAIFYFVMIRPQSKKQKELKRQREAMKRGDRVVTAGGIHGRLRDVRQDSPVVSIEIAPNVEIKVDKASVYPDADAAPAKNNDKKAEKAEAKEEAKEAKKEAKEVEK